jgi:hypothetical protein
VVCFANGPASTRWLRSEAEPGCAARSGVRRSTRVMIERAILDRPKRPLPRLCGVADGTSHNALMQPMRLTSSGNRR